MVEQIAQVQQAQAAPSEFVPERPGLAPTVELTGELQGSGFEEQQWLVKRDGQFIQVTQLLYRVAEAADGKRTLEEIAVYVTQNTQWIVTPDHVRQLVLKLLPLGIIAPAGGSPYAAPREQAASPLRLALRTNVLSPNAIEGVTRVSQFLFAWPVLVVVLTAAAVAHVWLYLVHGAGNPVLDVVYSPGRLLAVIGIMVVAGVFHEFGHASALKHAGGRVGGMGVGLYVIYPAFYTDTTDTYRLGRWGRVKTDLGGFYFHLIFALGTILLYLLTEQSFLLVVVLLINLDILFQSFPFFRLDGYWALTDLTGVPDFLSQAAPFLASVLPAGRYQGARLPRLKPWVRLVFASYLILVIPVLLVMFAAMLVILPWVLSATWDSLHNQANLFAAGWDAGNVQAMLSYAGQMVVLLLPVVVITYFMTRLARAGLVWSMVSARRRVLLALTVAVAMATLGFIWTA